MTAKPNQPRRSEPERLLRRGGVGYTQVPALAVDGSATEVDKDEQNRFARDARDRREHEGQAIEDEIATLTRQILDAAEALLPLLQDRRISDRGRRQKRVKGIINLAERL